MLGILIASFVICAGMLYIGSWALVRWCRAKVNGEFYAEFMPDPKDVDRLEKGLPEMPEREGE